MACSGPAGRRRSTGPVGGHLFIFFKYEVFVSARPQAVRSAWVNIWGVRRVCGTLLMFSDLFASSALVAFTILCEFIFSKKVQPFVFRPTRGRFGALCNKIKQCACDAQFVPVWPPSALA
jgi:hypothetical protein